MKKILKIVPYLVIAILVGATVVYAAPLSKLLPPGPVANTMYSLQDIYDLATSGTPATEGVGAIETTPAISETGVTLTQVYEAVETMAENVVIPPTFAPADSTSYDCSWFTDMTDPTQDPSPSSADICGMNNGCTWNAGTSQCDGGIVGAGKGGGPVQFQMTWYAAKAACAASTADGQTAGTWKLPTHVDLFNFYVNTTPVLPWSFGGDIYWSDVTRNYDNAYTVSPGSGFVSSLFKNESHFVRCVR